MTRVASKTRFSASVRPEMRMARACSTRSGVKTATVRNVGAGLSASAFAAATFASAASLPTEENLPVPIQTANPTVTRIAAAL